MTSDWPYEFPGANWQDEQEREAVLDVLREGSLFRYYGPGKPTKAVELETHAKSYYGAAYALAVNSGTGALLAGMQSLGVGPGDEVIVPAFLWVATVGAVVHCNAIPVLCEIDDSFTMNPADLEKKITPRTKLIVPVHMAGVPSDMERIMAIADKYGIAVLEDCAQCNGGSFKGKMVGTFGQVGMFSFQLNKNVTSGEGGLLLTDDKDLFIRLNASHDLGVPWRTDEPEMQGEHMWGQGRRISELCAAVAGVQLKKLPKIVEHMLASNRRIRSALADVPGITFRRLNDEQGNTGPFIVLVLKDEQSALAAVKRLKENGLKYFWRTADYGLHVYSNIPHLVDKTPLSPAGNPWFLPANSGHVPDYTKGACPASDDLFGRSIVINVPSRLTTEQENFMIDTIRGAVSRA